ncbi:MAG TPA: tRNA lysidine(34) synthetase TilS, partial [Syntrophales bacterium]|nr:tRNA lysidine(34) synthetase TilS [Syntrophales bacterium]
MDFIGKVTRTIGRYGMIQRGDRVGAAVSGGPDSMALLHALLRYRGPAPFALTVLHLNHGLRGDQSDGDEAFVRAHAADLGLPFLAKRVPVGEIRGKRKGTLEELGREERYRFFEEAAGSEGLQKIALGHHRDDQAETILMNVLRGSG